MSSGHVRGDAIAAHVALERSRRTTASAAERELQAPCWC